MGFDLAGLNVKGENGDYFHTNCWGWRPIWWFLGSKADDILTEEDLKGGESNCMHEISEKKADAISERIDFLLKEGYIDKYSKERIEYLENLPLEECDLCQGTGKRKDMEVRSGCNKCLGKGSVKNFITNYPFNVEELMRFAKFVEHSGGFNIG